MPRIKTYYAEEEIVKNLYTTGSQWMYTNFVEYQGPYHIYTTGEVYTQSEYITSKSLKLIPFQKLEKTSAGNSIYKSLKKNIKTKYQIPNASSIVIMKKDVINGYITRYFYKKVNETTVTETNKTQYDLFQTGRYDKNIYKTAVVKWIITGETQDIVKNGVVQKGVIEKNNIFKQAAIRKMPELETVLTDPLQYYVDDTYNIPVDINGLDS